MRSINWMKGILLTAVIAIILFGGLIVRSSVASAKAPERQRYYTSVRIADGDTLWTVAEDWSSDSSAEGIRDYVEALKEMNGIVNERGLKEGSYLMVYYD